MTVRGGDQFREVTGALQERPAMKPKPLPGKKPPVLKKPQNLKINSKMETSIHIGHENICKEGLTYLSQVHRSLIYLLEIKEELTKEFVVDNDISKNLTRVFRDVESLKSAYDIIMENVDKLKTKDATRVYLYEVFLDPVVSNLLKIYKPFISQYSDNSTWIGDFYKRNPQCNTICDRVSRNSLLMDNGNVVNCFYTVFNSLFSLELILERYRKCFKESNEHFLKTKKAQEIISKILSFINTNSGQEEFLLAHKELNLLMDKSRETKINVRFIQKGLATKVARRNDKPHPRQLVLFSDCLYVTLVPWNINGMSSVRQELSVSTMEVSEILVKDVSEESTLRWGLTISGREAVQDFYFDDQQTMSNWKKKLQDAIKKERTNDVHFKTKTTCGLTTLGLEAPRWQKDTAAGFCNGHDCSQKFNAMIRRHHCRADGLLYCDSCCSFKIKLTFERSMESRVCELCYNILGSQSEDPEHLQLSMKKLEEVMSRKTRHGRIVGSLSVRVLDINRKVYLPPTKCFGELNEESSFLQLYEKPEDKCVSERIKLIGMEVKRTNITATFILQNHDKTVSYQVTTLDDDDCVKWVEGIQDIISHTFKDSLTSEDEFESEDDFPVDSDLSMVT